MAVLFRSRKLICVVLPLLALFLSGSCLQLTSHPALFIIDGSSSNDQLNITCSSTASHNGSLIFIEIGKISQTTSAKSAIARLVCADSEVEVVDAALQPRINVSGSLNSSGGSSSDNTGSLSVHVGELQCSDGASYYCTEAYVADSITVEEITTSVTARTLPSNVTLTVDPPSTSQYPVGETLHVTCAGRVGNQWNSTNQGALWIWEWRIQDGGNSWEAYPNRTSVVSSTPTPISGTSCQYTGTSTLTHTLTQHDSGRQFRCYISEPQDGANVTIMVDASGTTPAAKGGQNACHAGNGYLTFFLMAAMATAFFL